MLGTGVCYLKGGEAMKVCPYSLSVEMAMVEMGVKYKLIYTIWWSFEGAMVCGVAS